VFFTNQQIGFLHFKSSGHALFNLLRARACPLIFLIAAIGINNTNYEGYSELVKLEKSFRNTLGHLLSVYKEF